MFWYIVICLLMLYPFSVVRAGALAEKKTQCVALCASCFILWAFMALRDVSIGVDTKYYSHVFTQFSDIPWSKVFTAETFATTKENWSLDFEYGYRLYNKLVSCLSDRPQTIVIFNSLLIIVLLFVTIKRQSPNYMLSIWLYITLGVYQTEMNVARNAIAILMVYVALELLEQKKLIGYILCCVLAAMFHKAAILFVPLYWIVHMVRWEPKRMAVVIFGALVVGITILLARPVLLRVLPSSMERYLESDHSKLESVVVGMFNLILFLLVYVLLSRQERAEVFGRYRLGVSMFTLNLACFALNFGFGYAARAAALFGPYMIVFLPQMLQTIQSEQKRRVITVVVAVVCGCQYILRCLVNNIGGTMPYVFFW